MKCDIFRGITKLRCVAVKSPWAAAGRGREEIEWGAIGRSVCEGGGGSLHLHPRTPLLALRSLHSSPTRNWTKQLTRRLSQLFCPRRSFQVESFVLFTLLENVMWPELLFLLCGVEAVGHRLLVHAPKSAHEILRILKKCALFLAYLEGVHILPDLYQRYANSPKRFQFFTICECLVLRICVYCSPASKLIENPWVINAE
jgi:hypothetical protein